MADTPQLLLTGMTTQPRPAALDTEQGAAQAHASQVGTTVSNASSQGASGRFCCTQNQHTANSTALACQNDCQRAATQDAEPASACFGRQQLCALHATAHCALRSSSPEKGAPGAHCMRLRTVRCGPAALRRARLGEDVLQPVYDGYESLPEVLRQGSRRSARHGGVIQGQSAACASAGAGPAPHLPHCKSEAFRHPRRLQTLFRALPVSVRRQSRSWGRVAWQGYAWGLGVQVSLECQVGGECPSPCAVQYGAALAGGSM